MVHITPSNPHRCVMSGGKEKEKEERVSKQTGRYTHTHTAGSSFDAQKSYGGRRKNEKIMDRKRKKKWDKLDRSIRRQQFDVID